MVELVQILQVDKLIELLPWFLIQPYVRIVLLMKSIQHGGQQILNTQLFGHKLIFPMDIHLMLILRTPITLILNIHHTRAIMPHHLIHLLNTMVPFIKYGSLGLAIDSKIDFTQVLGVFGLYLLIVVVVLVVVVVEALRGEEVGLRLGKGGEHWG